MTAMNRFVRVFTLAAGTLACSIAAIAQAPVELGRRSQVDLGRQADAPVDLGRLFKAELSGYTEVLNPAGGGAVSTPASGTFTARLAPTGDAIEYELSYKDLIGNVTQSHIHFGQTGTTGGIMVWLCETPPDFNDPTDRAPTCPAAGTVSGQITSASIIGPASQGIAAGEFEEVVKALQAGSAYVNVHTTSFPPGEIRGQVK